MTERQRHCPHKPFSPLWYPEHQKGNHNIALSSQNYNEISFHTHQDGYYQKKQKMSVGNGSWDDRHVPPWDITVLPSLVSNSWPQAIFLPQPPEDLGRECNSNLSFCQQKAHGLTCEDAAGTMPREGPCSRTEQRIYNENQREAAFRCPQATQPIAKSDQALHRNIAHSHSALAPRVQPQLEPMDEVPGPESSSSHPQHQEDVLKVAQR
ncbi:hypothetical protein AAY473_037373 [Plecturocebus cupreus]